MSCEQKIESKNNSEISDLKNELKINDVGNSYESLKEESKIEKTKTHDISKLFLKLRQRCYSLLA